tara:strand:+ start:988 stop:1656 length:669 start_codon:yes stop_codon:yes gene_type:complete
MNNNNNEKKIQLNQNNASKMDNEKDTLAIAAFVKAQRAFGAALKTASNPHFKSRYADLSACVEAVIEGLNNNGLALLQFTHPSESGVAVETVLLHEGGGKISGGILHVPASKQDAQGYGSALTYARRYSLMATCGIAPEDDDGNAASRRAPQPQRDVAALIQGAISLQHLQTVWQGLSYSERSTFTAAKDKRKAELTAPAPAETAPVERDKTIDPKTGEYTW